MNNEKIIEALSSWNFWGRDHDVGIWRERYLERLESLLHTGQVTVITGARRSGKSTLMKQFIKKRVDSGEDKASFLYVNFEDPRFAGLLSLEFLQRIYESYMEIVKPEGTPFVLLDEVQNVPQWERFVRSLHEKKEARIIVSGSSSSLLSRELGALLTGRWVGLEMYPLDFPEFLRFKGVVPGSEAETLSRKLEIKRLLRDYLEFGGFPLVSLSGEKEEVLRRHFDDAVGRDVAERHNVRNTKKLKALARYYLTAFSSPISYRRVAKFIGLSLDTVERFSAYLADACLLFFVPKFSYSLKEQEVNPRKVYGVDPGMINITGFRFSENKGRLYENVVFLSLLREGKDIYYHRGKSECDFLVKEGQKITQAVQVSYDASTEETEARETRGLLEAMEEFKLSEGLIITEDKEGGKKIAGKKILYRPLWKWLLKR